MSDKPSNHSKAENISVRLLGDIRKMIEETRAGVAATVNAGWNDGASAPCEKKSVQCFMNGPPYPKNRLSWRNWSLKRCGKRTA